MCLDNLRPFSSPPFPSFAGLTPIFLRLPPALCPSIHLRASPFPGVHIRRYLRTQPPLRFAFQAHIQRATAGGDSTDTEQVKVFPDGLMACPDAVFILEAIDAAVCVSRHVASLPLTIFAGGPPSISDGSAVPGRGSAVPPLEIFPIFCVGRPLPDE
jgi:hypothetical protein